MSRMDDVGTVERFSENFAVELVIFVYFVVGLILRLAVCMSRMREDFSIC